MSSSNNGGSNSENLESIASSNSNPNASISNKLNNDFSNLVDDFINKLPSTADADGVITDDDDKAKVIQLYNLLFNDQGAVDDFTEDVNGIIENIILLLSENPNEKDGLKKIFKDIGEDAGVVFEGHVGGRRRRRRHGRKTRRHRRRHSSRRVRKVRRAATHRRRHRRRGRKTRRHH